MPLPEVKVGQHSAVISGDSLELIVHRGGLVKMAAERSTHDRGSLGIQTSMPSRPESQSDRAGAQRATLGFLFCLDAERRC